MRGRGRLPLNTTKTEMKTMSFETLGEYWDAKAELKENKPELYKMVEELCENGTKKELDTVFSIVNTELWKRD